MPSGFPKSISHFLKKVNEDEVGDCRDDEDDKLIKLEDRLGNFKQSVSIQDKYKGRPKNPNGGEWKIVLAQFATCYQQASPEKLPKDLVSLGDMSEKQGESIKNYIDGSMLPKYIRITLSEKKHIFMYLRMFPKILRIHASTKKDGYEQQYADMQLFHQWRDEKKDLHLDDEEKCIQMYHRFKVAIFLIKTKMLPCANVTEDMNELINNSEGNARDNPIYDTLDPEFEKDNSDVEDEETEEIPMPQTNFDVQEDSQIERNERGEGKYKYLALREEDERLQLAKDFVPEQMMVLQEVVKFCKLLTIPSTSCNDSNSQLRLIVHGGAGTFNILF